MTSSGKLADIDLFNAHFEIVFQCSRVTMGRVRTPSAKYEYKYNTLAHGRGPQTSAVLISSWVWLALKQITQ